LNVFYWGVETFCAEEVCCLLPTAGRSVLEMQANKAAGHGHNNSRRGVACQGPFRAKNMKGKTKGSKKKNRSNGFFRQSFLANEKGFGIDKTRLLKKNALGRRTRQRAVGQAKGAQNPKRALRRTAPGAAGTKHGKNKPRVARGPRGALCESKPRRAVLLWLTWRPTKAHAAVLLCPGRPCRSARRHAGGSQSQIGKKGPLVTK
jgi:hypothetical protein